MNRQMDYTVDLGEGLKAMVRVRFEGQQAPSVGDDVVSSAVIFLPTDQDGFLDPRIEFGDRLSVGGSKLVKDVGYYDKEVKMRSTSTYRFSAKTMQRSMDLALDWGLKQLNKLKEALEERRVAYEKAMKKTLYDLIRDQLTSSEVNNCQVIAPTSLDDLACVEVKVEGPDGPKTIVLDIVK